MDEAIADLDRAIQLDPNEADYFGRRAKLKHEKGDFSGMIADMARASEVMPSAQISLINRMRQEAPSRFTPAALLRGRLKHYDRAIAENPAFSWGYYHRGVTKHLANDLEGALADFRRCSDFPDSKLNDYAAIHLWLVRVQKGETAEARAELSTHFSGRTNRLPPSWEWQIAGFLVGQVSEADFLATANAAGGSESERRSSQFWYYKAMRQLLAGDEAKASEFFREALSTKARPYAVLISAEAQSAKVNQ